jgi:hypothetical protein
LESQGTHDGSVGRYIDLLWSLEPQGTYDGSALRVWSSRVRTKVAPICLGWISSFRAVEYVPQGTHKDRVRVSVFEAAGYVRR